jgi:hypothetical protein
MQNWRIWVKPAMQEDSPLHVQNRRSARSRSLTIGVVTYPAWQGADPSSPAAGEADPRLVIAQAVGEAVEQAPGCSGGLGG